jgi:predicted membrane protein
MEKTNLSRCATQKKNNLKLMYWTLAWVLSMALIAFGPKLLWSDSVTLELAGILINFLIGMGMIFANRKFINNLDELQRKIHLEAMALALGIAVVTGLSYSMLDVRNLISFDAEISHVVIIIGLTYLAGTVIGSLRYK